MSDADPELPSADTARHEAGGGRRLWAHRTWWLILVAAAACVATVVGLAVYLDRRSGVSAGTLFQLRSPLAGDAANVELPVGSLDFTVSRPLPHLPKDADPVGHDRRDIDTVRDFGRYVGVGWTLHEDTDVSPAVATQPKQFTVSLVAGNRSYDLRAAVSEESEPRTVVASKSVALALPGNPKSMTLRVTYDGMSQTVDLPSGTRHAGAAQPYYSGSTYPVWSEAGAQFVTMKAAGFDFDDPLGDVIRCTGTAAFTSPYVDGTGWAATGRRWLVVPFATATARNSMLVWPKRGAGQVAYYSPMLTGTTVLLNGTPPVAVHNYFLQGPTELMKLNLSGAYYVFDIPAASVTQTMTVHQDYVDLSPDAHPPAGAPKSAHATVDITVRMEPA